MRKSNDVAAVQVFSGLVAEAERTHRVTRLVRGQLTRKSERERQFLALFGGHGPQDLSAAGAVSRGIKPLNS